MNRVLKILATEIVVAMPPLARAYDTNVIPTATLTDNATPATSNAPPVAVITTNAPIAAIPKISFSPVDKVTEYIVQNGVVSAGIGANINGDFGPTISEGVALIGNTSANTNSWALGVEHTTFFSSPITELELGIFYRLKLQNAPAWTKHFLLLTKLPRELQLVIGVDEPIETIAKFGAEADWGRTTGHIDLGWKW